jgi:hypothetical protein
MLCTIPELYGTLGIELLRITHGVTCVPEPGAWERGGSHRVSHISSEKRKRTYHGLGRALERRLLLIVIITEKVGERFPNGFPSSDLMDSSGTKR